jgi:putative transcriptional regulator
VFTEQSKKYFELQHCNIISIFALLSSLSITQGIMYKPIHIDREKLTIMGVSFPDLETLLSVSNAIGSNMYEGFEPTPDRISLIRDYVLDKITFLQFVNIVKNSERAR